MSENNVARRYNFSDATLKQVATTQIALILRDIADFSQEGFDATAQTEYETKLIEFYNFPSDDQLESDKMICTQKKNVARENLEQKIRMIHHIAQTTFPRQAAYQRAFGDTDLSRQSDFELMQTALTIQQSVQRYQTEMQVHGLNQAKINSLELTHSIFKTAYQNQQQAIHNRDISVHNRITAGNLVYDLLVRYARLGQLIYANKYDPRHNDYVIYTSSATNTAEADDNVANTNNSVPPIDTL
jgi:hypothetical protein